ncbi:protein POLR1D-like isoform X1 [Myxocyprinus asiaticus]|uniref:protein POLR1D-like isoform X1 n=1 Tax=Myxocyprinus asiaticus TaxID=70543 RepID=UPI002221AEF0|nr:protein POLR1D-like isoform X1 [Myxocyprinus asiaticus]
MDDSELERKAVEELLNEANRAKVRVETMGPAGWMKCPLGSTNKRFLLNTLRSSALMHQPKNQGTSERGRDEHRYSKDCEKHHIKDCEVCSQRKDNSHRRYHSDSHSHSLKHSSSSRKDSSSRSRSPYLSRKSNRTRSRSPVRDRSAAVHKHKDGRKK